MESIWQNIPFACHCISQMFILCARVFFHSVDEGRRRRRRRRRKRRRRRRRRRRTVTVQECWAMVRTQRESAQLERIQIPRKQVAYGPLRRCSTLLSLFFCLDLFEISQQKNQMPERETERDRETNEGEGEEEDWWRRCVFAAEFQPNCQRFFFLVFCF